jgi:hypothetical protein
MAVETAVICLRDVSEMVPSKSVVGVMVNEAVEEVVGPKEPVAV